MQVPQIIKDVCKNHVDKFRNHPDEMAESYAWLAAGYCVCYVGLLLTMHQLDKKERELDAVIKAVDNHNAYISGWNDGYKLSREVNTTDNQN